MTTKYIDYLKEDTPIAGQNFVCLSFVAPEVKKIKNCSLRGIKIRGVFNKKEDAEKHAESLRKEDPDFDIFVGEVGKWLPWDPNPEQVEEDRINREKTLERLGCELDVLNNPKRRKSSKAQCKVLLNKSMGRYVKELKSGQLKIDKVKIKQEEKLDGKYLLSTSDPHLSAEDIALGYKHLMEVERAFRTLKGSLSLRPIYHSKDDRIRSHVLLCGLALLLIRIAEVETQITWPKIRR